MCPWKRGKSSKLSTQTNSANVGRHSPKRSKRLLRPKLACWKRVARPLGIRPVVTKQAMTVGMTCMCQSLTDCTTSIFFN